MSLLDGLILPELPERFVWNALGESHISIKPSPDAEKQEGMWHHWWAPVKYSVDGVVTHVGKVVAEHPDGRRRFDLDGAMPLQEAVYLMHQWCLLGFYGD